MRKILIGIGILVVLLIGAVMLIPQLVNLEQYRGKIQAELQQRLNRPVTFGAMKLRIIPLAIRVSNATVGEDPQFGSTRPFASVQELDVHAKLLPLIRGDVQVSSITLTRPQVELIRNAQGVWNFSTIGQNQPQTAGKQQTPAQPQAQQQQAPQTGDKREIALDNLEISDGTVALTDLQKHQSRAVYDHIDVNLKNFAPNKRFSIDATAHLPGPGRQVARLQGDIGPINDAAMLNTAFDGKLKVNEVSLSAVQKFLNTEALANTDAMVTGDTSVKNENGKLHADGSLKLDKPRVRGVDVGYPITADYNITDDLTQDVIQIRKMNLKLGNTPFNVTGTVNTKPTPALLDVKLNASDVSIAEASRLAAAFGFAFNPGMQVAGRVNADIHAQGASSKPVLNGNLTAKDLAVTGKDLPAPVKVPGIALALSPQAIQSNDFTASAGNTNVAMKFTLTQYASPSPVIDTTIRTANANIAELLNMAKAYGVAAAEGMTGSGTLNLDVRATGPVKQSERMTFAGSGKMVNASVKTADLQQPLNVKNADVRFTSNSAELQNLAASLGSTHAGGSATVRNFNAPHVQFNLNADQVNVAELQQITTPPSQTQHQPQQQAPQPQRNPQPASTKGPSGPQPAQPSMLAKMTGGGTLLVGKIVNDQLVLNNVRANVVLDRGVIRLAPLTAMLYGGQINGTITADTRTTPMGVTLATKLERVDANQLVSSTTSLKNTIYGLLASNGNLSFQAADSNNIARTLNGNLSLNLLNGKIAKIDVLNQLASIGKFAGFNSSGQKITNVAKLSGGFDIRNGVATTNNLQAAIEGGTVAAAGSVNLADQSLNMKMTAVLAKGFSDKVGGTGIGGFMNTALANNKGELVMPVLVTGTFDNPHFAPDMETIAQMKLKNLLPTSGNPGQLSTGILGAVLGGNKNGGQGQPQGGVGGILGAIAGQKGQQQKQQTTGQQQQQQQPADAVADALGGLLGGKKKNQQQQQPPPPQ